MREQHRDNHITVLGFGPNPARDAFAVSYVVDQPSTISVTIRDSRGAAIWTSSGSIELGLSSIVISTKDLANGRYIVELSDGRKSTILHLIKE